MTQQLMPDCLLPLQGAFNFRDMGGLKTGDGRLVKKGLLFRAAELTGLTEEDHLSLRPVGLKHVFDYRNREEAVQRPDPAIGDALLVRVPANLEAEDKPHYTMEQLFSSGMHKVFSDDMLLKLYASLPIANASYKHLMKLLSAPADNLPLVTGVGSFLILATLGVPYETVMEDYLLSNVTLADYHQEMYDTAAKYVTPEELLSFRQAMELQPRYLDASRNAILDIHGSFERYLEEEFGIDEAARRRIQEYCLE